MRHEQGHFEEAEARSYRAPTLRLKPELAAAHGNLGTVSKQRWAISRRRKAAGVRPCNSTRASTSAPRQLATLLRLDKLPDTELDAMRRLLAPTRT